MRVTIDVVLDIQPTKPNALQPSPQKYLDAARQAVRNTLDAAEGHGFEHDLSGEISITVMAVHASGSVSS